MDIRGGLDIKNRKILPILGLEIHPLSRPASSQSLNWLRYSDIWKFNHIQYQCLDLFTSFERELKIALFSTIENVCYANQIFISVQIF
jgi:hypothetical protein